ncbi:hypothetical protein [Mesorhizobium sp. M2A.F.Ca.ET.037.01.1.1]|uniref:hypothetical protein n=1 Tax=Mesorhizobium sp. M2A.F.Ca.ET.037.01.1.1 TaxID=2496748 RepID=UPI001AECF96D|nr:hypothetical protein [Mesorhizobium sp. M2A.F.Ca.ET.037.01.1.1]
MKPTKVATPVQSILAFLQIADDLHQEKPGHDYERQDDDESDHAAPRSMRLRPNRM